MITFEGSPQDTLITQDKDPELYARVEDAVTFRRLSDDATKLLEVVEERDGEKFVTRCYTPDAVQKMEMRGHSWGDLEFPQVWSVFRAAFSRANVPTVPSVLLEGVKDYQFVIVSDYIQNDIPVTEAPTETKKEVAAYTGRLVTARGGGLIRHPLSQEIMQDGMFMIAPAEDEQLTVAFTDMDPLLSDNRHEDDRRAAFIDRAVDYLWHWSEEEERSPVIGSFLDALDSSLKDNFTVKSLASAAFTRAFNMMNGADPSHANVGQLNDVAYCTE